MAFAGSLSRYEFFVELFFRETWMGSSRRLALHEVGFWRQSPMGAFLQVTPPFLQVTHMGAQVRRPFCSTIRGTLFCR